MQKDDWMVIQYNHDLGQRWTYYDSQYHDREKFMFHPDCRVVEVSRSGITMKPGIYMKEKKYKDGWYDFGCSIRPVQVESNMIPCWPYRVFKTEQECLDSIIKRTVNKI